MKIFKTLSLFVTVLMLLSLAAGCSTSPQASATTVPSAAPTATTQPTSTATVAATATPTPQQTTAAPAEPVTLSFVYWADGTQKQLVEAAISQYEKSNANITINAEVLPSTGEFAGIIASRKASGTLPDVSYMGEGDVVKYNEMGILADMSSLFSGDNATSKLDCITIRDKSGKIIGVGLSNQLELLYYNKKLFDAAGISYPPTKVENAWTWDQFVDAAKKLTKDSSGKNATEAGFKPKMIKTYGIGLSATMAFHHFWALYSNGGGVVSADGSQFLWDKPESAQAFQDFADLINVDHVANAATNTWWTGFGNVSAVDAGGCAMMFNGSWDLANIPTCSDPSNIGVAVLPKFKTAVTMNCGAPIVAYNTSKHIDEALKFAGYMLNPANNLPLLQSGAWLPNESSWYTDADKVSQWTAKLPKDAVETILSYSTTKGSIIQWPAYYVPAYSKMDAALASSDIDKVFAGKMTAQQLFDSIMPKMKQLFESGTVQ
jgi:multiple sugar transport system substrate-binding protein